jgi:hypothetical protein
MQAPGSLAGQDGPELAPATGGGTSGVPSSIGGGSASAMGVPRRSARAGSAQSRSRSHQKSLTARQMTAGLAPVAEPATRG